MATDIRKNLQNFFKDLKGPIIVFDIETIPDVDKINKFYTDDELSEKETLYQVSIGFHKIVCISYATLNFRDKHFHIDEVQCIFNPEDELDILLQFSDVLLQDNTKLVTFNGNNYDLPVIEKRALYLGFQKAYSNDDERIKLKNLVLKCAELQNQPWNHLDLFWLLNLRGQKGGMSLMAHLLNESKHDDMKGWIVHDLYKNGDYDKLKAYSIKDAELEAKLFIETFNFFRS